GSSGGEGAFIGAGGAPFGLGADVGGSIRLPAFFNGVFGHKPSVGLVPNSGQYPLMMDPKARLLSTGPLARRAEDLHLLLQVLMGPDGVDPVCRERELGDPSEVDVSDLVVYVVPGLEVLPPSQDMLEAQRKAAVMLERLGAEVREVSLPEFEKSFEIWGAMMYAADGPSFGELMGKPTTLSILRELTRWGRRRSPHTLPALLLAVLEKVNGLLPQRNSEMVARGEALERELTSLLGARGVLLFPSFPTVAPRHISAMLRPFHSMYTGLFNALAMPVTQAPLGLDRQGLPLGVQIVAPDGADHRTIAVGLALEDAFGGWVPPWHVV
ncbi:MAG: amidase family protein, partial [Myxococcota bacterium]